MYRWYMYDVEFDLTLRWTSWPSRIIFRLCWFLISPFNFFFYHFAYQFFLPFCISIYQQLSFCTVHQIHSHVESCHKQLYTNIKHNCIHGAMALIPYPQQLVKLQNCIISGMPSWGKWKIIIIIKRN